MAGLDATAVNVALPAIRIEEPIVGSAHGYDEIDTCRIVNDSTPVRERAGEDPLP